MFEAYLLEVEAAVVKRLVIVVVKDARPDFVHLFPFPFPACHLNSL